MAEHAERAFARTFLNTLATQPITYADDYQQPSAHSLKRVPVLPIAVPPPPDRKPQLESSGSSSASISLTFKSLKPPASFTLRVEPTDTVADIKSQLAALPSAPPADVQRLLLKGKALADSKLLKDYTIKDGDTVNLMVKPGHHWDPTAAPTQPSAESSSPDVTMSDATPPKPNPFGSGTLDPHAKPKGHKHQRIPSVVLSPSPSSDSPGLVEKDIVLTLDPGLSSPSTQPAELLSTFHDVVADPGFWGRLYEFLQREFKTETDINMAFEDFLRATKGSLTASEIAKIRDIVGVVGMGGT